jgi:hypothetical protein
LPIRPKRNLATAPNAEAETSNWLAGEKSVLRRGVSHLHAIAEKDKADALAEIGKRGSRGNTLSNFLNAPKPKRTRMSRRRMPKPSI